VGHSCRRRDDADWSPSIGDSVHLWRVRLDRDDSTVGRLTTFLSPDEQQRARGYHFARDRKRFIVRRGILRTILARYVEMPPQELQLATGKFGKPELSDVCHSPPKFSLTHSQGMAMIALAQTSCVGVDLECVQPLPDLGSMINVCLSPSERGNLQALPHSLRLECFYRYWTCKEAWLKALGVGLNRRLKSFQILFTGCHSDITAAVRDPSQETLQSSIWSFAPSSGYIASTATTRTCTHHELYVI